MSTKNNDNAADKTTDTDKTWFTVAEASRQLSLSKRTIWRRIEKGTVESKVEDGHRLVLLEPVTPPETPVVTVSSRPASADEMLEHLKSQTEEQAVQIKDLNRQISDMQKASERASERHDTLLLQLTSQLEQSQRLLEYKSGPWWRRFFSKKNQ